MILKIFPGMTLRTPFRKVRGGEGKARKGKTPNASPGLNPGYAYV